MPRAAQPGPSAAGPRSGAPPATDANSTEPRRGFLGQVSAVLIGGIVALVPAAAGLFTFADPLRARSKEGAGDEPGRLIKVTTLDAVPDDDTPRQFPVIADRQDAWNLYPNEAIGAVYLRRAKGSSDVVAFNATCPHAGCFVAFNRSRGDFQCPCHDSAFNLDGEREHGPSPRDLDSLETKLEGEEVWVRFVEFHSGKEDKIPKT
jgi:menaquinol-cytochrome c reductase iron-sulfur subunit